jgi:hypothetical protein
MDGRVALLQREINGRSLLLLGSATWSVLDRRPDGPSNSASRHRHLGKAAHVPACARWAGETGNRSTSVCISRKSQLSSTIHSTPWREDVTDMFYIGPALPILKFNNLANS